MPFDGEWFDELRSISESQLQLTKALGIDGYTPHVGELCRDGYVTSRFLDETLQFVRLMNRTRYRFDTFFRAYPRHMFNFPRGRAFRKQWNIGVTAGETAHEDHVRVGIGFRLSPYESAHNEDYLEFQNQVRERQSAFDETFNPLGNYCEFWDAQPTRSVFENVTDVALSRMVINDEPTVDSWRFFGKRLSLRDPEERSLIGSHERLRGCTRRDLQPDSEWGVRYVKGP